MTITITAFVGKMKKLIYKFDRKTNQLGGNLAIFKP